MKTEGLFFREVIDFPKRSANLLNFCKARDSGKNTPSANQLSFAPSFLTPRAQHESDRRILQSQPFTQLMD